MWKCLECGRKFRTTKAAEKASRDGCPGCGGVDIDLDVECRDDRSAAPEDASIDARLKRIFLTRNPKDKEDER